MTDKSYVTLEQAICPVCGVAHDTGTLLLDRRLRPSFEHKTATHYDLCPEHKQLYQRGFLALVGTSNKPRPAYQGGVGESMKLEEANRTGSIMHVKYEVVARLFKVPIDSKLPMVFVEEEVITNLKAEYERDNGPAPSNLEELGNLSR